MELINSAGARLVLRPSPWAAANALVFDTGPQVWRDNLNDKLPSYNKQTSGPGEWCSLSDLEAFRQYYSRSVWAVVLTEAESEATVGHMRSSQELLAHIESFWGMGLVESNTDSWRRIFNEWLDYFREHNHTYGVVHAWVAMITTWPRSKRREDVTDAAEIVSVRECASQSCDDIDGVIALALKRLLIGDSNGDMFVQLPSTNCEVDNRPRRIWDLCANTVIPITWFRDGDYQYIMHYVLPVSHAWVADHELAYVVTAANQRLWPIPLPQGMGVEDIRQQLLRYGARFAWVDVLCLRQRLQPVDHQGQLRGIPHLSDFLATEREKRRLEEWATDVPLIGNVFYGKPSVLIYLNGLGRPFRAEGWDHPRHWLNRAWTLQETTDPNSMVIVQPTPGTLQTAHRLGQASPVSYTTDIDPWSCKAKHLILYSSASQAVNAFFIFSMNPKLMPFAFSV
ncbi:hypothetical protein L211DRAFT_83904 [Terfezia boudieri ATCC MYA-4762]|uniref:Heterokaryon incompatibility domain-containing protein n=1 Tax=Terfezia boudieri ATCC MYA-4762 TaxID=1051890 RepID=A0A3N4LUW5_9PEZI|nr:hypothetical protein L211DRAFT_83904 [Terfezia boudieri ATCC MYA-4762]